MKQIQGRGRRAGDAERREVESVWREFLLFTAGAERKMSTSVTELDFLVQTRTLVNK